METILAFIALGIMIIAFVCMLYVAVKLKYVFKTYYSGEKTLFYRWKIIWLKNNIDSFDQDGQKIVRKLLLVDRFSILLIVFLLIHYFIWIVLYS